MHENWLNAFVFAPRAIGSCHRVPTQGEPSAYLATGVRTFGKVELGAPSLSKTAAAWEATKQHVAGKEGVRLSRRRH